MPKFYVESGPARCVIDASDAQVFDTLDIVPVWQGYAFPWC